MSGPYDQHQACTQGYGYDNQYQYQSYNQNAYPSEGLAQSYYNPGPQSQNYPDTTYSQPGNNSSYYNDTSNANRTAPVQNGDGPQADRGLLGAVGGGAAGAWGGHKVRHGVLGALGGAIVGSLAQDYAKKKQHRKPKKHHKHHGHGSSGLSSLFSRRK